VFEVLVGFVMLAAVVHGARRGFVRQFAAVACAAAAAAIGLPLSKDLAPLVDLPSPWDRLSAFGIISLLMGFLFFMAAGGIRKRVERHHLAGWDGLAGALLGAAKGFALATAVTIVTLAYKDEWRPAVAPSPVARVMSRSLEVVHPWWPPEVHPLVHPYVHYLDPSPAAASLN
jgi:uncharacterized membrane protein required for colicin V production